MVARHPPDWARPLTSFIGREREITALADLLTTQRVTTVLGPPGVGKTRLALEVAARRSDSCFCDLTEANGVDTLCAVLSRTLEVGQASGSDVVVEAGRHLASLGRALVVLDNFEQLLPSGAQALASWVRIAPEIVFLITSRQRLGLAGEALFDLEPLPLPGSQQDPHDCAAVRLFVDRARSVCRDFARADRDLAVVAEIVRELDGLPLAIELCAARARVLSPTQILQHLPSRRADVAVLDPTLRLSEAIESSWQNLSVLEQRALAQCSAFRGGFDVEAAAAVLDLSTGSASTLEVLEALVDKSLLSVRTVDGTSTRRMSAYLSVRERAERALLESGEASSIWERHGAYYATRAFACLPRLRGPEAAVARRWLAVELDNLLAAHTRALDSSEPGGTTAMQAAVAAAALLCVRGPIAVGLELLDRAIAAAGDSVERSIRGHAQMMRVRVLRLMGRPEDAVIGWERSLELADDALLRAAIRTEIGAALVATSGPAEARSALEAALEELGTVEAPALRALVYENLGDTAYAEDDLDRAERHYSDALQLYERAGDVTGTAAAQLRLGMTHLERGAIDAADRLLERSAHQDSGNRLIDCLASGYRAVVQQERGELLAARVRYERVVGTASALGFGRAAAVFSACLASCLHELGQIDAARAAYERALSLLDAQRSSGHDALVQACLGALHAGADRVDEARALFEAAEATLSTLPEQRVYRDAARLHRAHLDFALARAAVRRGDAQAAATHRRDARERMVDAPLAEQASSDVRFALRLLHAAFDAEPAMVSRALSKAPTTVTVAATGAWFLAPDGEKVDIRRRMPLRRIILRLAEERRENPGRAVAASSLIESAWPGEGIAEELAVNRLRVALSTLRKLGLASVLLTRPGGYLFDPQLELELVPDVRQ